MLAGWFNLQFASFATLSGMTGKPLTGAQDFLEANPYTDQRYAYHTIGIKEMEEGGRPRGRGREGGGQRRWIYILG